MKIKIALIILCFPLISCAQISNSVLNNIINKVSKDLIENYIDSTKGLKMAAFITAKYKSHGYDTTMNIEEICCSITNDLRLLSSDILIGIEAPDTIQLAQIADDEENTKEEAEIDNYFYGAVKIVNNDIGYFEINDFSNNKKNFEIDMPKRLAFDKVADFMKPCKYLVIDLRNCKLGTSDMVLKFLSYFIDTDTYIYSEIGRRPSEGSEDYYIPDDDELPILKHKKVYILTGYNTMGYAELAAYSLRKYCHAFIIGDNTAGVAHISYYYQGKFCNVIVPALKMIDSTNNNYTWQGKGISPDIHCNTDNAYDFTLSRIYNLQNTQSDFTEKFLIKPPVINSGGTAESLKQYCGFYMRVIISLKGSTLYSTGLVCPEEVLQYIKDDTYETKGGIIIFFKRDAQNNISGINLIYKTGLTESYRKTTLY